MERRNSMGLLERVSTLIRANLNDMIDRAEDPEKMIKQVILDMENQYLQVKTQVAVSIADLHLLEKRLRENDDSAREWMRKAELSVDKSQDDLARAALDRFQVAQRLAQSFREQVDDQHAQVEILKGALQKLSAKLDEAKSKRDLLIARHRRGIALGKAARAQATLGDQSKSAAFDRLHERATRAEAVSGAEVELLTNDVDERLNRLDRDAEVERLLTELKARRSLPA
jgi:phage shock protein A